MVEAVGKLNTEAVLAVGFEKLKPTNKYNENNMEVCYNMYTFLRMKQHKLFVCKKCALEFLMISSSAIRKTLHKISDLQKK